MAARKKTPRRRKPAPPARPHTPAELAPAEDLPELPEGATVVDEPPGKYAPKYSPQLVERARHVCQLGATSYELGKALGVCVQTIDNWRRKYPEFCEAVRVGKEEADERVKASLYHRAVGYTFQSEKVFQYQGGIVRAEVTEHVPPDVTAGIFWLKNRMPEQWRDSLHHVDKDGNNIELNIPVNEVARRIAFILTSAERRAESEKPAETAKH